MSYFSSKQIQGIREAYLEMYTPDETLEMENIDEADSLAAMQARREKRLARQRKQMGTSSTGQDFGHNYGISSDERKKRQQAEFDKFVGKKTKKEEVETPYDIVMEYLLAYGHADTVKEAEYVMLEMDIETINDIVSEAMLPAINPAAHKKAQRTQKIFNKATQGGGSEKDWLKKTGPQLPGV